MFKKNNIFFGLLISTLITSAMYGIFYLINNVLLRNIFQKTIFEEQFLLIFAMGITILPMQYYSNRGALKTVRGMLIFAFFFSAFIIFYYFKDDLGFKI